MNILPVAFDSMGVRSMATLVETNDVSIFIDPGAALGPSRYGLPPHPLERRRLEEKIDEIVSLVMNVDVITISHYHYDHYMPLADFYSSKEVFVKNPVDHINASQKARASDFMSHLFSMGVRPRASDGSSVDYGNIHLEFSPPLWHGPKGSKLGYVIALAVHCDKTFVHTSDVQGPLTDETTNWIISQNPDVLFLCGVFSYFIGWRYPKRYLDVANSNVIKILSNTNVETLVIDHHLVRDIHFKEKIKQVFDFGEEHGIVVETAASYRGVKEEFLEAIRKHLYKRH